MDYKMEMILNENNTKTVIKAKSLEQIKSFVNKCRYDEDKNIPISHVSQMEGFHGSFSLNSKIMSKFWELYQDFVYKNEQNCCISFAEQTKDRMVPLCIDIDRQIKDYDEIKELYSDDEIMDIVKQIQTILKASSNFYGKVPDDCFDCVVLKKKPYINHWNNFLKNGIHLQFINYLVEPGDNRKKLFQKLKSEVSDEIDMTYNHPWLLFGSCKSSKTGSYKVAYIINSKGKRINNHNKYFQNLPLFDDRTKIEIEKTKPIEYYYPQFLSILNTTNKDSCQIDIKSTDSLLNKINLERDFHERENIDSDFAEHKDKIIELIEDYLTENSLDLQIEDNHHSGSIFLKNQIGFICPLSGKEHKRNHAYCTIFKGKIYFGCYSKCENTDGKKMCVIGQYKKEEKVEKEIEIEDEDDDKATKKSKVAKKDKIDKETFNQYNKQRIDYLFNTNCKNKVNSDKKYVDYTNFLSSRCTIVKAGLGSGKSFAVNQFIKNSDFESIIVLTPRITYANSVIERLRKETDIDFKLYSKIKGLIKQKFIVIQVESLHRLDFDSFKNSLVIMDECESIFNQMTSTKTHCENIIQNVITFESLLSDAKKVICLDAFVSQRTIKVLEILKINFKLFNYTKPYEKRTCIRVDEINQQIACLIKDLEDGKKIYFVCSSKTALEKTILSRVKATLPNKKILEYHGGKHACLKNVNESWKEADLILTTSTLTVGVNFDEIGIFDKLYLFANGSSKNLIRDLFQSTYRIRHFTESKMIYCIDWRHYGTYRVLSKKEIASSIDTKEELVANLFKRYEREGHEMVAPPFLKELTIYNIFEANLSIMCLEQLFFKYLAECGYTHDEEGDPNSVAMEWDDLELDDEVDYDTIETPSPTKLKELQEKKRNKTATEMEKLQIEKFFFQLAIMIPTKKDGTEALLWRVWCNYGKSKFKNLQIEKGIHEGTLRINELLSTTEYGALSKCLHMRTELIQKMCKMIGIKNSHDFDATISKQRLESILDELKNHKKEISVAFELRDDGKNEEFRLRNCTELINKVFAKWGGSKIEMEDKKKTKTIDGKKVYISPYKIVNCEEINLYEYVKAKNISPSLPVGTYSGNGVPL